jgi:hypothetical protein
MIPQAALTIRFVATNSWVGRAIRFVTNSLWEHVEFQVPFSYQKELGTGWLGAHAEDGVKVYPLNYAVTTREKRYAVPCSLEQLSLMMDFAKSAIGKKYDYANIAGLLLHDRFLNTPGRYICSMFVLDVLQAGRLEPLNVVPRFSYLVTPEMLHLSPLFTGHCIYTLG